MSVNLQRICQILTNFLGLVDNFVQFVLELFRFDGRIRCVKWYEIHLKVRKQVTDRGVFWVNGLRQMSYIFDQRVCGKSIPLYSLMGPLCVGESTNMTFFTQDFSNPKIGHI